MLRFETLLYLLLYYSIASMQANEKKWIEKSKANKLRTYVSLREMFEYRIPLYEKLVASFVFQRSSTFLRYFIYFFRPFCNDAVCVLCSPKNLDDVTNLASLLAIFYLTWYIFNNLTMCVLPDTQNGPRRTKRQSRTTRHSSTARTKGK